MSPKVNYHKKINFYYPNHITSNYKVNKRKLNNIFNKHIVQVSENEIVKLQIYYCPENSALPIVKVTKPDDPYYVFISGYFSKCLLFLAVFRIIFFQ